jgi:hypothetical protein
MWKFELKKKLGLLAGILITTIILFGVASKSLLSLSSVRDSIHPILRSARNYIHPILNSISRVETPALRAAPVITDMDIIREMLSQVNKDRALIDLRKLTGEEEICFDAGCYTIANRQTGSEGLRRAKDYIHEELVRLGYSVEVQNWSLSGYADQNIIVRKPGMVFPAEEIYFVAHIDGVQASRKAPAADDNASGVVDLLELARILRNYSFQRTVVLFFSTGEEQGTLGVKSYLDQLSTGKLSSIKFAVDVDMVGYDANQDTKMELWYGGHAPSLALTQIMSETIHTYQLDLTPEFVVGCG